MKLYREVKTSETCGFYLYKDHKNYTEPLWTCHLKPIEITEEEINRVLLDFGHNDYEGYISQSKSEDITKAILSKLKGE